MFGPLFDKTTSTLAAVAVTGTVALGVVSYFGGKAIVDNMEAGEQYHHISNEMDVKEMYRGSLEWKLNERDNLLAGKYGHDKESTYSILAEIESDPRVQEYDAVSAEYRNLRVGVAGGLFLLGFLGAGLYLRNK